MGARGTKDTDGARMGRPIPKEWRVVSTDTAECAFVTAGCERDAMRAGLSEITKNRSTDEEIVRMMPEITTLLVSAAEQKHYAVVLTLASGLKKLEEWVAAGSVDEAIEKVLEKQTVAADRALARALVRVDREVVDIRDGTVYRVYLVVTAEEDPREMAARMLYRSSYQWQNLHVLL